MDWIFDGWGPIAEVLGSGLVMYVLVIVSVRLAGKRSTAKMNNFDWIVTLAIASIVASTVVSPSTTVAQGIAAVAVLLVAQMVTTWATSRSGAVARLIQPAPTLVVHDGRYLRDRMRAQRVTEHEVRAALRSNGYAALDDVHAVVLESDGNLTMLAADDRDHEILRDVVGAEPHPGRG